MNRSLLLALMTIGAVACAAPASSTAVAGEDDIVSVPQTATERASIGASWLFAHASWARTLHAATSDDGFDPSPSYAAYWHWYDQLAYGFSPTLATGGNWETANRIATKYGIASESAFLAGGSPDAGAREEAALATISDSLDHGVLSNPVARRDRTIVRRELDRAWALSSDVVATMDGVFGAKVERTFAVTATQADATDTFIVRPRDFTVAYANGPSQPRTEHTLADAMVQWTQRRFQAGDRSAFLLHLEQAVHDGEPVMMTWFVDFNALEQRDTSDRFGVFNLQTLGELGPGTQAGHTTILEDYTTKLATGQITRSSAIDPNGQVLAFKFKNAWGAAHPDRVSSPGMPDHPTLDVDYLTSPVKRCTTTNGVTSATSCPFMQIPLESVVLPPGY